MDIAVFVDMEGPLRFVIDRLRKPFRAFNGRTESKGTLSLRRYVEVKGEVIL